MAVRVVDRLEAIDVEHDQTDRPIVAAREFQLLAGALAKPAPIGNARQRIGRGRLDERLFAGDLGLRFQFQTKDRMSDPQLRAEPQQRWTLNPDLIDEGAVARSLVFDRDGILVARDLAVLTRNAIVIE